jgi:hypothetical protein
MTVNTAPVRARTIQNAEFYNKLADRAWNRFHTLRDIEWKANLGVWTIFLGGGAVVISATNWAPNVLQASIGSLIALVFWFCYYCWLIFLNRAYINDLSACVHWENQFIETLGFKIYQAPLKKRKLTIGADVPLCCFKWAPPVLAQLGICFLVCGLFAAALWCKWCYCHGHL